MFRTLIQNSNYNQITSRYQDIFFEIIRIFLATELTEGTGGKTNCDEFGGWGWAGSIRVDDALSNGAGPIRVDDALSNGAGEVVWE